MPQEIANAAAFETATKDPSLTVVHFAADFAHQCGQVNDVLDALAKRQEYSNVKFYKCEAEQLSDVALRHKIEAVPTVLLFRDAAAVERIEGADAAKITAAITAQNALLPKNSPQQGLEERLRRLVRRANVMLFMKGDRKAAQCGFSRQMIKILNEIGVEYDTFDILGDEEVRQGLKSFSDWPTYPQLYVKGELVGGLDIVKEMLAAGELQAALKN